MLENRILYFFNQACFPDPNWPPIPPDCKCEVTTDKSVVSSVKCIIFHLPSLTKRDLLILPQLYWRKHPSQIWVIDSMESAANYPLLDNLQFLEMFDYEMSYKQSAPIWIPYLDESMLRDLQNSQIKPKNGFCAAFISSRVNKSRREELLRELMQYVPINSYGKFMQNRTLSDDKGRETKIEIISEYRFTLAFENSICPDYVTEKFYEPLIAGSIPVYLGAPNIDEFSPGNNVYINAAHFEIAKDLAEYMKAVNDDDYHVWRHHSFPQSFVEKIERKRTQGNNFNFVCDLMTGKNTL